MKKYSMGRWRVIVAGAALLSVMGVARAASGTWTGATDANWADANWSASPVPGSGDVATFNGAGNGRTVINLGSGVTLSNIIFNTSSAAAYTIGSGAVGSQTLTLNDSGMILMNSLVANSELFNANLLLGTATGGTYTLTNASTSGTLTFAGNIQGGTGGTAGNKTLVIAGAGTTLISGNIAEGGASALGLTVNSGTLTLSGANSYSGLTRVNGGTLKIGALNTLSTGTTLLLGDTANSTLDLSNYSQTIGALLVNTNTTGSTDTITIGAGQALTVLGSQTNVILGTGDTSANHATTLTATGAGALVISNVNGTALMGGTGDGSVTVDLSKLGNFTAYLSNGTFKVGTANNASIGTTTETLALATNSTITASNFNVDLGGAGNAASLYAKVILGSGTNTLNVDNLNVGVGNLRQHQTQMIFTGSTGMVTLRASDGSSAANVNIGIRRALTDSNIVDFTGHFADLLINTLDVGGVNYNTGGGGLMSGSFSFDTGTTRVNAVRAGSLQTNVTAAANVLGTINLGGGVVSVVSNVSLGVNLSTPNNSAVTGMLNVTGGTVSIGTNGNGNSVVMTAGVGTNTANVNLTGGTVTLAGAMVLGSTNGVNTATLMLNGSTLDLTGHNIGGINASNNLTTLNFLSGTLQNVGQINNGAQFVKTGAGMLTLAGINSFSGDTIISAGTVLVNNQLALQKSTLNYSSGTVVFGSGLGAFTLGGLAGTQNLALTNADGNAITLTVGNNTSNTTYFGTLSQGGSLAKLGNGTLILAGANTYGGGTTLAGGTLNVSNDLALGAAGGGLTFTGGTLQASGSLTLNNRAVSLTGNGTINAVNGATVTMTNAINGVGALTVVGAGTVLMNGVTGSTFGLLQVNNGGTLNVSNVTLTSTNVTVGGSGSFNTLNIYGNSVVDLGAQNLRVGTQASTTNNTLQLVGGIISNVTTIFAGENGAGNSLIITNGAQLIQNTTGNRDIMIGNNSYGNSNMLLVAGGGALMDVHNNTVKIGNAAVTGNALRIDGLGVVGGAVMTNWATLVGNAANASYNQAIITSGGQLFNASGNSVIGNAAGANNNSVYIGTNASWSLGAKNLSVGGNATASGNGLTVDGGWVTNVSFLYVGASDSFQNQMTITNGGQVFSQYGSIGDTYSASNNTVLITGNNSLWNISTNLYVGTSGYGNCLIISNGGQVMCSSAGYIGVNMSSRSNSVLVTGLNSVLNDNGEFDVGRYGFGSSLTLANGGQLYAGTGYVGNYVQASNNTALVTGSGSVWSNSAGLVIGSMSQGNSLTISNGGKVYNTTAAYIGSQSNTSNNNVLVTGSGSAWNNGADLVMGNNNNSINNGLTIANSGQVFNVSAYIGNTSGASNNFVLVTDPGSVWSNSGSVVVGSYGANNSLTITNGGQVLDVTGYIGTHSSGNSNSVLVIGNGSVWRNSGDCNVGYGSIGSSLTIAGSGQVFSANGNIGFHGGNNSNSVLVTGPGSSWSNTGLLTVGNSGVGNSVVVTNGGQVSSAGGTLGDAAGANNNSAYVGANAAWNLGTHALMVGGDAAAHGNWLTVEGGVVTNAGAVLVGTLGGTNNVLNLIDSAVLYASSVTITATNQMNIDNGTVVARASSASFMTGAGTVQINAGGATFDTAGNNITVATSLADGGGGLTKQGLGALTLTGNNTYSGGTSIEAGLLQAGSPSALPNYSVPTWVYVAPDATLAVNAGGAGQWQANDINTLLGNATFANGAQFGIDTTGGNFSYGNDITSATVLLKLGANMLTLSGANTYSGGTVISNGILRLAGGDNRLSVNGDVAVFGGLDLNGQDQTINALTGSGVISNGGATVSLLTLGNNFTAASNAVFTGTIEANASKIINVIKVGAGTQTLYCVTGSASLAPTGTVNAGTLVLAGNVDNNSAVGVVNNGGTLILDKVSSSSVHALGSGLTINSGGTVLLRGSGGDQIYKNNTVTINSGGVFDLGGQSEGFDILTGGGLVTNSVASASVLTNGMNNGSGTFSGQINEGAGGATIALVKVGSGMLTLSGVNNYSGGTTINGGRLRITSDAQLGALPGSAAINLTLNGGELYNNNPSLSLAANRIAYLGAGGGFIEAGGAARNVTINGQITGVGGLGVIWDQGRVILNGSNSYAGATTIGANGNFYWSSPSANPTLQLGNNNALPGSDLIFGTSTLGNTATLDLHAYNATVGALTGGANAIVDLVSGGGSSLLTVGNNDASGTFGGVIKNTSGSVALAKIGAGTLTLSGANSYSGGTTISNGTLALTGSGTLGSGALDIERGALLDVSGTSAGSYALGGGQCLTNRGTFGGGLSIASGALVTGGGSFNGAVTNLNGGFLTAGSGGDTNFFQSLSLSGGSTNSFWIASQATHDMSVVTNSLTDNGGSPQLRLDLSSYTKDPGALIVLYENVGTSDFNGTSQYFLLSDTGFGALDDGLALMNNTPFFASGNGSVSNAFTIHYDYDSVSHTFGTGGNDIALTVIPEPASLSLLALFGMAFWMRLRTRRVFRKWH